ncbi:MAG TPA: cardiolipin synthase [Myxococcaceae bacterium]|nr:cardiolipin synthase [Myxococcaceae bacterium]
MVSLLLVFHVLGLISSCHAVMTNRTAQGAIAWAVSLNTFPYLAVPLYWVFGRSHFEGYRESWKEHQREIEALSARARQALEPFTIPEVERLPHYQALKKLAHTSFLRGNEVELLVDGKATFDSILPGLARARRYALVQFYIVHDDDLGRRLKAAMIDCVKRGVEVFFIYDEIGSAGLPRAYLQEIGAAGVKHSKFNSERGVRNRFQLNFRNHRKNVVIDGLETWLGGHNVGNEYLGLDKKIGPWRDTHVHVTGPAAQLAQLVLLADWYWATRTLPEWSWEPQVAPGGASCQAMVVPFGPADDHEAAQLFFVQALDVAKQRIWIANAYFIPDDAVMAALRLAALRGVDVRVITPAKSDNSVLDLATLWFMERLDGVGIKFYRHAPGMMHQKVFLVDDDLATVGSTNFDNRSFRLQFEVNALFLDRAFASQMERMLLHDLEQSEPYDPSSLRRASFPRRLAVSAARLTAPLL